MASNTRYGMKFTLWHQIHVMASNTDNGRVEFSTAQRPGLEPKSQTQAKVEFSPTQRSGHL